MPSRAHDGDAGVDLYSAVDVELAPGRARPGAHGIAVAIPHGMVGLVHPRSGLAARVGLSIVNSPGTIDAGYRGEIKVTLINLDPEHADRRAARRPHRTAAGAAGRAARVGRGDVVRRGRPGRHNPWRRRPRFLRRTCEFVKWHSEEHRATTAHEHADERDSRPTWHRRRRARRPLRHRRLRRSRRRRRWPGSTSARC